MQKQTLVLPVPTEKASTLGKFIEGVSRVCIEAGIEDMTFVLGSIDEVLSKLDEDGTVIEGTVAS